MQTNGDSKVKKTQIKVEKQNENSSTFFDIVYCDHCFIERPKANGSTKFFLTTCSHILCEKCSFHPKSKQPVCHICKSTTHTKEINDDLSPDYKIFFDPRCIPSYVGKFAAQLSSIHYFRQVRMAKLAEIEKEKKKRQEIENLMDGRGNIVTNKKLDDLIRTQQEHIQKQNHHIKMLNEQLQVLTREIEREKEERQKQRQQFKRMIEKYDELKSQKQKVESQYLAAKIEEKKSWSSVLPYAKQVSNQTPQVRISMPPPLSKGSGVSSVTSSKSKNRPFSVFDSRFTFSSGPC